MRKNRKMEKEFRIKCMKNIKSPTGHYYYVIDKSTGTNTGMKFEKREQAEKHLEKLEEFNLSEKIITFKEGKNIVKVRKNDFCPVIHVANVKEFIKRERKIIDAWSANLKRDEEGRKIINVSDLLELSGKLNKLAGEKLIWKKNLI